MKPLPAVSKTQTVVTPSQAGSSDQHPSVICSAVDGRRRVCALDPRTLITSVEIDVEDTRPESTPNRQTDGNDRLLKARAEKAYAAFKAREEAKMEWNEALGPGFFEETKPSPKVSDRWRNVA